MLRFESIGAPFGALVYGWDSEIDLSVSEVRSIRDALAEYSVLVFRGHRTPEDGCLVSFAQNFGTLIKGSPFFADKQCFPEILRVNNLKDEQGFPLGTGGAEACDWHSDYSYMPQFGTISFLEALAVPASGGCTYFANTRSVWESLSDTERERLMGLNAYHDTLAADRNIRVEEARKKTERDGGEAPAKPSASHPMVVINPNTGQQTLYINPMLTRYIEGLSAAESHRLLEDMFARITDPDNVYAHQWQVGDLVMWDNVSLIHRRDSFDPHDTRSMRQLTALLDSDCQIQAA